MTFGATNGCRAVLAVAASIGLAALAWAAFAKPSARVVYNASESVPVGWYRIETMVESASSLRVGGIVLTRLPAEPAALAAQRGYLPAHIPLLKRIGAVSPQHVCVREGQVRIDGTPMAVVLQADRLGRAMPVWSGCRALEAGEVFLLSDTHPGSFDSRYFGPIDVSSVMGLARPLGGGKPP